jgi:hypothetical protein
METCFSQTKDPLSPEDDTSAIKFNAFSNTQISGSMNEPYRTVQIKTQIKTRKSNRTEEISKRTQLLQQFRSPS